MALASTDQSTAEAPASRLARPRTAYLQALARRCEALWRSPQDQPRWARPALLGVAAAAALAYAWRASEIPIEPYYGGAARSMAGSWHDFLFGAFDPAGTTSVDKLPGALWLQALSLRAFSFHVWALVLPQVLEGAITVLVLFRAMRRLAGPVAGITAAALLAINPATVALNRGNVSDSLLVMLSVLAADATVLALKTGRLRTLLLAGAWVGLAFQAKMMQAWLIVPALAASYLVAAPPRLRVRAQHVALASLVMVAVSLSWMTAISLVPSGQRPYVDGTHNNSLFSQVFDYNGISRIGGDRSLASAEFLAKASEGASGHLADRVPASWHRLLDGPLGRDIGWLLPAALIAAVATLIARRGLGRGDPLRVSVILWGLWLIVLWVAFSGGVYLHAYYVAALAPALAGLCGTGAGLAWPQRHRPLVRGVLAFALLTSAGYGIYLLNGGMSVPGWLVPAAVILAAGGLIALLLPPIAPARRTNLRLAFAIGCMLLLPVVASEWILAHGLGSFAAPFAPTASMQSPAQAGRAFSDGAQTVEAIESTYQTPIAFAVDTARLAAPFVYSTGKEILPIGGFLGRGPVPTLKQLQSYISSGRLRALAIPPASHDPRLLWIYAHCRRTPTESHGAVRLVLYACTA